MKRLSDSVVYRRSLLQLLRTGPPGERRLLLDLKRKEKAGKPLYAPLLHILTHLTFSERAAGRHWSRILEQREKLRLSVGRDVGLRVAILDYFVNLNRELRNPKVIEIAAYERTERSALTDGLTGLFNHAYFEQALQREIKRAKRYGHKVSLVLFDLDNFKKINDTQGHVEGDRLIARTAALLKRDLREVDVAARYGGEEFALVLPDTPRPGAFVVADRIRQRIGRRVRVPRGRGLTISGGIATFPDDAATAGDLVRRADEGLYLAKAQGKDRIAAELPRLRPRARRNAAGTRLAAVSRIGRA